MQLDPAMIAAIAAAVQAANPPKKARGKKAKRAGRVKLSDEQKAINAAANADVAVKMFQDAGYENCVAHETIRTYGKWEEAGRRVTKGQKALRSPKGVPLFHRDQTSVIAATN